MKLGKDSESKKKKGGKSIYLSKFVQQIEMIERDSSVHFIFFGNFCHQNFRMFLKALRYVVPGQERRKL